MINVAIFGTGSNGERAWQAATARADVHVVCFVDNDPSRQGTHLHDRPVLAPAALQTASWDFIVLASMYAPAMRQQLIGDGISADLIVAPGVDEYAKVLTELVARKRRALPIALGAGTHVSQRDLPDVLIVTCETLNSTHGTGVLLQRFFADFDPNRLFSVCHTDTGKPWLTNALVLPGTAPISERVETLRRTLREHAFRPSLVYATAFNEHDLELLEIVLDELPAGTSVVQHFMDYMPFDRAAFDARFMAMQDRVAETWALTEGLAGELTTRYRRDVTLVTALHQDPPASFKRTHRTVESGFRAAILGNIWQPRTLDLIRDAWQQCRSVEPRLGPIDWYVHPMRVQCLIDAGYEIGDDIRWKGFYQGDALQQRLQQADLAILPFNPEARAENGYAKFSLPSRLTELCGAGLPIVAVASPDSEPARVLARYGIGITATGPDPSAIASALLAVIGNRDQRAALGACARTTAETTFALAAFQQDLLKTFVRLAGRSTSRRAA